MGKSTGFYREGVLGWPVKLTLSDEEVEESENDGVTTEHVISTRSHSLQTHASSSPNQDRSFELRRERRVGLKKNKDDSIKI